MFTRIASASVLCLSLSALPALAFDPAAMSTAEKDAFGAAVRSYLVENPEVLMEAIGVLEKRQMDTQASAESDILRDNKAALRNSPDDWAGGNLEGDVTVVEFLDYRCGYCRKAWSEVEDLVEKDGNVRVVYKEFPILSEDSLISSKFAIAVRRVAGDEAYKKAHDLLITMQGPASDPALKEMAEEIGVDFDKVAPEMESAEVAAIIEANRKLAEQLQIQGTPTFVINDTLVRGYVPADALHATVLEQRELAAKPGTQQN